jgi:hypothetical protein
MPASNAIAAFGTLVKLGDSGSPETFTTIAELGDVGGPNFSTDTDEVTTHASPSGHKEYVLTLIDSGEVTFNLNFLPGNASHSVVSGLLFAWKNRLAKNFQMVFPDSTQWAFKAAITKFDVKAPVKNRLSADVSVKILSMPTLA